jgi:thioredoxin 1
MEINMVKDINGLNELDEVLRNNKKVLVDVWAPWCGPCRMLGPIVEKVADTTDGLTTIKINLDDNEEVAVRYGIEAIPTLLVFENGELVNRSLGFVPEQMVRNLVK